MIRGDVRLEYPYRHSTGPVVGAGLAAFAAGVLAGGRCGACGAVGAPPRDWCERCGGTVSSVVAVGPGGTVTAAAPVHQPTPLAPLDAPFSWVLVRLDGADTDLLHVARGEVAVGTRVRPVWRAERRGAVTDLECFEPGEPSGAAGPLPGRRIEVYERLLRLPYTLSAGTLLSRFFADIRDRRRIHGVRCTSCRAVIVPPFPSCQRCWAEVEGWVPVADRGEVETFVVVNVPFFGQEMELPYVLAHIRLDGADTAILHVLGEVAVADVRVGMRVEAVWGEGRSGFLADDIRYFRPEP